ncbi:hypothetical protein L3X38_033315 [Prunus dulcis]|uniref:Retrotransposon gag domain-containing protein n=1 Tax=Prunus dulcis TaxID=3755 RepID=A0AAD4VI21_PRUDU|nr:hypothetical protein L3X38_033315 [Prunus dulcis]
MTFADQARRIGAINFDGDNDLAAAEDWIENVENIMEDPSAITWQIFETAFDEQFYPLTSQNMKMEEFQQLEQGSMTMMEYEKNMK